MRGVLLTNAVLCMRKAQGAYPHQPCSWLRGECQCSVVLPILRRSIHVCCGRDQGATLRSKHRRRRCPVV